MRAGSSITRMGWGGLIGLESQLDAPEFSCRHSGAALYKN